MAPPLPLLSSDKSPETTKPASATNAVLSFRSRLVSLRDWCVAEMETAANSNPLLKSILSVHANFHRFRQTQLRNPYSLSRSNQNCLSAHNFAAILPGDSVAGLVVSNGISNFLSLYNTLLVVRLVLTWFPGAPPAIVTPLSTICDPYLNIFRGLIPPLGGTLDLSPILAFLVLNAFTSTAAALPAELPTPSTSQEKLHPYEHFPLSSTTSQQKWTKRVCNQRNKNSRMSD